MSDPLGPPPPPDGASPEALLDWFNAYEGALAARGALEPVLRVFGVGEDAVEIVDGKNPKYPGLTFDFAVTLPNGATAAVELGQIVLPTEREGSAVATKFCRQLQQKLDEAGTPGQWSVTFPSQMPDLRTLDEVLWLQAMCDLTPGDRTTIDGCSVWRAYSDEPFFGGIRVHTWTTCNFVVVEPTMKARFGEAIDANRTKLMTAAAAGFDETHFIAWHRFAGSTEDWQEEVATRVCHEHPQHIWISNLRDAQKLH